MQVQEYLTVREAAAYMRISHKKMLRLLRDGEIPFREFSAHKRMVAPADCDAWAESKFVQNQAPVARASR